MTKNILAIITARGGSKGVPRKNIRPLGAKPLIAWTIEAALQSSGNMRLIVSTDDAEIAAISREYGAEIPFLRPAGLADDTATSMSVVLHAITRLAEEENYRPELILLLQPTSPFRSSQDIDNALKLQGEANADAVVSVTPNLRPVQLLRNIDEQGLLVNALTKETVVRRRQDADRLYELNGAVYIIKPDVLLREQTFYPDQTRAYIMPAERSLDIDTEFDFLIAELFMRHQQQLGKA
jgi:N-acylneuraminate cytidylyltransferase/CMP-N,N'-diacetyllegionaminic acid synthase